MLEIALKIIICLILAALLGWLIGYLMGKAICKKRAKHNNDDSNIFNVDSSSRLDIENSNKRTDLKSKINGVNNSPDFNVNNRVDKSTSRLMPDENKVNKSTTRLMPDENKIDRTTDGLKSNVNKIAEEDELGTQPLLLTEPRNGKKDNLQLIKGVGSILEGVLNDIGIYHFDQIANLNSSEIKWLDRSIAFPGRIERERWVDQAKILAAGKRTVFAQRVERGEVSTSKKSN